MVLALFPVAAVLFFFVVRLFVRNFVAAWVCTLALSALNYALGTDAVLLAGLHISPADLLCACLFTAGIIRSRIWELRLTWLGALITTYIAIFFLSAARGIPLYGLTSVGNEGRGLIGEVLGMTYFVTISRDPATVRKVVRYQILYSAFLVAIVVLHYAGLPVGGSVGVTANPIFNVGDVDRALPAPAVASIELSLIFAVFWVLYEHGNRWFTLLTALFTATVIFLQHRTVWAMLILSFGSSALVDKRVFRHLLRYAAVVALLTSVAGLLFVSVRTNLTPSLQQSATNGATFGWRLESWQRSIDQDETALAVLFGQPFGSGYTRIDSDIGQYTSYQPHDEYVNQYLRVGLVGAFLLIMFLLRPVYLYLSASHYDFFPRSGAWCLVAIAVITYGVPYSFTLEIVALAAMANGLLSESLVEVTEPAHHLPEVEVFQLE